MNTDQHMHTERKMIASVEDSVASEQPNKLSFLEMKVKQRDIPTFEKSRAAMRESNRKAMKKLVITIILSLVFMAVEIVGGIVANSVALLGDAGHLATDALGVSISVIAICIAQKHATKKYSYGFHRAEVLGALVSIFSIWIMLVFLCMEAVERVRNPPEIDGPVMLYTAILSIVFNLIMIKVLHSGDGHSHGYGSKCSGHSHNCTGHGATLCGGHMHDSDDDDDHDHHHHHHGHDHDNEHKHGHCHTHGHDHGPKHEVH